MTSAKQLRKDIVAFITPFMTNQATRQAYISGAFWDQPFANKIVYSGSAHDFSSSLFDTLWAADGKDAIKALLDEIADHVGENKRRQIEQFKNALDGTDPADMTALVERLSQPPASSGPNISIGGNVSGNNVNFGNQTITGDQHFGGSEDTDPKAVNAGGPGWFARHQVAVVIATIVAALLGLFGTIYATTRPTDIRILPVSTTAPTPTSNVPRITVTP